MADYFILPESIASDGISPTPDDFDDEIDRLALDELDGAAFERIVGITFTMKARSGASSAPVCAGSSYVPGPATTLPGSLKTSEHRRQTVMSSATLLEAETLTEENGGSNLSRRDVGAAALKRLRRAVGRPRAEGGTSTVATPRGRR